MTICMLAPIGRVQWPRSTRYNGPSPVEYPYGCYFTGTKRMIRSGLLTAM